MQEQNVLLTLRTICSIIQEKGVQEMAKQNNSFCPSCFIGTLVPVGERTGGFSGGKAVVGAVVAGPVGLAAGLLGKKKVTYQCDRCGYKVER